MTKLTRGAWRAALDGTALEPTTERPTINRGAPRKISNLYGRVEREALRREAEATAEATPRRALDVRSMGASRKR
jgi:hypothetical protein